MSQESVFITNEGQFVYQTADKKLITTSSTIQNHLLSPDVRAPIYDILEPRHSGRWCKDQNMSVTAKYKGLHQRRTLLGNLFHSVSTLIVPLSLFNQWLLLLYIKHFNSVSQQWLNLVHQICVHGHRLFICLWHSAQHPNGKCLFRKV